MKTPGIIGTRTKNQRTNNQEFLPLLKSNDVENLSVATKKVLDNLGGELFSRHSESIDKRP